MYFDVLTLFSLINVDILLDFVFMYSNYIFQNSHHNWLLNTVHRLLLIHNLTLPLLMIYNQHKVHLCFSTEFGRFIKYSFHIYLCPNHKSHQVSLSFKLFLQILYQKFRPGFISVVTVTITLNCWWMCPLLSPSIHWF